MSPREIVDAMLSNDDFSRWLGIEVISVREGYCQLSCTVRPDMLNGHKIAHGGISYSLSDSALAFAANTYGQKCVSIETSIYHLLPIHAGDQLTVSTEEIQRGNTLGVYAISIVNQNGILVSQFKGTVHISKNVW